VVVSHLTVDVDAQTASLHRRPLPLRRKEFDLLALMARHPGRVLTRERIAREVWGGDARGRTIDIHVARLRASLPPGAIETVVKVGYRFSLT
jgi:two-component system response regulator MtrA